jgi:hypothetical protein
MPVDTESTTVDDPPVETPVESAPPQASPVETPQGDAGTPPASTPAETPAQQSLREQLQGLGLAEFGQVADDSAALRYLAEAYSTLRTNGPALQQYQQYAPEFQQWMASRGQQQQQAQPAADQAKKWWNPPEYRKDWENLCEYVNGQWQPKPFVSPEIAAKLNQHQQWRVEKAQEFWNDPFEFLKPALQPFIEEQYKRLSQSTVGSFNDRAYADEFVKANANWMIAQTPDGQIARNPQTGAPEYSPNGAAFLQYVKGLARFIPDIKLQQQMAMALLERDILLSEKNQQTPAQTRDAANMQVLASAAQRTAGRGGTRPTNGVAAPTQNPRLSLKDKMRKALKTQGFTDDNGGLG